MLGDLCGNCTCYNKLGSSVIDYIILNEGCFSNVLCMKIDNLMRSLSDHCKLSIAMSVNFLENSYGTRLHVQSMPAKFKWEANSIYKFQSALYSTEITTKIKEFKAAMCVCNSNSIETALADVNSIFSKAASLS